jgi:hypothetical protein
MNNTSSDYDTSVFLTSASLQLILSVILIVFVYLFYINRDGYYFIQRHPVLNSLSGLFSIPFTLMECITLFMRVANPNYSLDCPVTSAFNTADIIIVFAIADMRLFDLACISVNAKVQWLTEARLPTSFADIANRRSLNGNTILKVTEPENFRMAERLRNTRWYHFYQTRHTRIIDIAHLAMCAFFLCLNEVVLYTYPPTNLVNHDGIVVRCNNHSMLIITVVAYVISICITCFTAIRLIEVDVFGILDDYKQTVPFVLLTLVVLAVSSAASPETLLENHNYVTSDFLTNFLGWSCSMLFMARPNWSTLKDPLTKLKVVWWKPRTAQVLPYMLTITTSSGNLSQAEQCIEELTDTSEREESFKSFLARSLCIENYTFYKHVSILNDSWSPFVTEPPPPMSSPRDDDNVYDIVPPIVYRPVSKACMNSIQLVYKTYIPEDAPQQVNLSSGIYQSLVTKVKPYLLSKADDEVRLTTDELGCILKLFISAKKEIALLLAKDPIIRYKVTKEYQKLFLPFVIDNNDTDAKV